MDHTVWFESGESKRSDLNFWSDIVSDYYLLFKKYFTKRNCTIKSIITNIVLNQYLISLKHGTKMTPKTKWLLYKLNMHFTKCKILFKLTLYQTGFQCFQRSWIEHSIWNNQNVTSEKSLEYLDEIMILL